MPTGAAAHARTHAASGMTRRRAAMTLDIYTIIHLKLYLKPVLPTGAAAHARTRAARGVTRRRAAAGGATVIVSVSALRRRSKIGRASARKMRSCSS